MNTQTGSKFSWGLWIPFIWYFLVSTRSVSRWLWPTGSPDADLLAGNSVDSVVYTVLICLGLVVLMRRKVNWFEFIQSNKWLIFLFLYMALSIIWSNFPEVSARRWARSAGTFVMTLVILTEANPLESISAVFRRCYFIHLPLSIISIKYFRNIGVSFGRFDGKEEWTGLAVHKNNLGQVAMSSGVYFVWDMVRSWGRNAARTDLVFLLMALWLLGGSSTTMSKTSIFGFGVGICLIFGFQYLKNNVAYLKRYALVCCILLALAGAIVEIGTAGAGEGQVFSAVTEASGRDQTLTGRTDLWHDILVNASKNPIAGVGYGAFWIGEAGKDIYPLTTWSEKVTWRPNQGHNGYLDAYAELGIIGLILIGGVIVAAFKNIGVLIKTNFEFARLRTVFLSVALIHNITESSLLNGWHSLWFIFLLFAINMPVSAKEA